ncbi:cell_wall-binding repeat-containing protein [Hexamita inflata]|uniref:Cell_wall-binding repeat-containing protein n=1 Tax=Hexamita inflata TaxID=28002 RepID=A0ABP1GWN6_9EUKA
MDIITENRYELAEYNLTMIKKFKDKIRNGELKIQYCRKLTNLEFQQELEIHKLILIGCQNIVPTLKSCTLKELVIQDSNLQNIDGLELENLEILDVQGNEELCNSNFKKFKKLTQLYASGTIIDISLLVQLQQLRILNLSNTKLQELSPLQFLVNLEELYLSSNYGIITNYHQYIYKSMLIIV